MALNLKKAKEENQQSGDYSPIQEGRYNYIVDSGEMKTSKSGTPMMELQFTCLNENYKNRKVWHNFPLTENAQIYLIKFLEAGGLEDLTTKEQVDESEIIRASVGKKVSAHTEINTGNNGKSYNNLKNFTAPMADTSSGNSSPSPAPASAPAEKKSALFG